MNWKTLSRALFGDVACICESARETEPEKDNTLLEYASAMFLIAAIFYEVVVLTMGWYEYKNRQMKQMETCILAKQPFALCYETFER